jgi:RNA polymerase sigma-70 factor, ECF subfamily
MSQDIYKKSEPAFERNLRWQSLIAHIANEHEESLGKLYNETNRLLYSLALQILSNDDDAEEVMLDVYKYVWKSASNYDPEQSNPATWLVMLTRSRAIDKLRSRKNPLELSDTLERELSNTDANPEDSVMGLEKRQIVLDALSELSPKQRKVIELSYFYQFNQSEIAQMLEMPVGSVKSTIRLAKEKLKNTLILFESGD